MDIEELLKDIGITKEGNYGKNNSYIIDITNSQEFGKIYSMLEKYDGVDEVTESSLLTEHNASLRYLGDDYQIDLLADFDQDTYRLVVTNI